jgi:hypothetical protein
MQPSVAGAHSAMVSTRTFGSDLHARLRRIWRCGLIRRRSASVHLRQRGFIIVNEDDTGSCLTHKAARNPSPNDARIGCQAQVAGGQGNHPG